MFQIVNPLLQKIKMLPDAPFGSSQMTKNLLEIFLIKLRRNKEILTKDNRFSYIINGVEIPYEKGLLGHSDADVLLHAIMDAL